MRTGIDSNAENAVLADAATDAEVAALTTGSGHAAAWHVRAPGPLGARLVARGAVAERTAVVMGAPVGDVAVRAAPPGVDVVPVTDAAGLADGAALLGAPFTGRWVELLAAIGFAGPLQHRVARRGDAVAGLASFLVDERTLLVLQLAVAPPSAAAASAAR